MEAKEVVNKILSEAKEQAQELIGQAKAEAGEYEKQTLRLVEEFDQGTEALAKKAAEDKAMRLLAAARMKSRKDILGAKQKALDAVFAAAREKLAKMEPKEYRDLFGKLIGASVQSGDETLLVGRSEELLDSSFAQQLSGQIKGAKLSIAEGRGEFEKGVVLLRGNVRTNISVAVLLEMARESLERELVVEFFNG